MRTVASTSIAICTFGIFLTGCASDNADRPTSASPTPTNTAVSTVSVSGSGRLCDASTETVPAGEVKIDVRNVGKRSISVTLFAPQNGQWTKAVGVIPLIDPGGTRSMTVPVTLGAYEIACQANRDDHRARLNVV